MQTARVHHASRRRGGCVAARCACAAGGDPRRRLPALRITRHICTHRGGGSPRSEGSGLRRGPERDDRIPLGGWSLRPSAGAGGRAGAPSGHRDHSWRQRRRAGCKGSDRGHSYCVYSGADPVWSGLVGSLSRPGGNLTGASLVAAELAVKRLEVIRELLPQARAVAMIVNPNYPGAESEMAEVEAAGRVIGLHSQKVKPATCPRSKRHSRPLVKCALMPSRWAPTGFSSPGVSRLLPWPHATRCPASTRFLIFRRPAASRVTAPASPMRIDKPASTPDGFSKGPSRPTCPSRNRSSSSGHQPQDRESARPHNSAGSACPRRQGDRIMAGCPLLAQSGHRIGSERLDVTRVT